MSNSNQTAVPADKSGDMKPAAKQHFPEGTIGEGQVMTWNGKKWIAADPLPFGGKPGQVLMLDEDGNPEWRDLPTYSGGQVEETGDQTPVSRR